MVRFMPDQAAVEVRGVGPSIVANDYGYAQAVMDDQQRWCCFGCRRENEHGRTDYTPLVYRDGACVCPSCGKKYSEPVDAMVLRLQREVAELRSRLEAGSAKAAEAPQYSDDELAAGATVDAVEKLLRAERTVRRCFGAVEVSAGQDDSGCFRIVESLSAPTPALASATIHGFVTSDAREAAARYVATCAQLAKATATEADPVLARLAALPLGPPITARQRARFEKAKATRDAGKTVPHEAVMLVIALRALRETVAPALRGAVDHGDENTAAVKFIEDAMVRADAYIREPPRQSTWRWSDAEIADAVRAGQGVVETTSQWCSDAFALRILTGTAKLDSKAHQGPAAQWSEKRTEMLWKALGHEDVGGWRPGVTQPREVFPFNDDGRAYVQTLLERGERVRATFGEITVSAEREDVGRWCVWRKDRDEKSCAICDTAEIAARRYVDWCAEAAAPVHLARRVAAPHAQPPAARPAAAPVHFQHILSKRPLCDCRAAGDTTNDPFKVTCVTCSEAVAKFTKSAPQASAPSPIRPPPLLPPGPSAVLRHLASDGEASAEAIAEALHVPLANVRLALERLCGDGLVRPIAVPPPCGYAFAATANGRALAATLPEETATT